MRTLPLLTTIFFAGVAAGQTPTPTPLPAVIQSIGPVGIAAGQTARLTVLNPPLPAPFATGIRCTGTLSFFSSSGDLLKSATVTVNPNNSASLDLKFETEVPSAAIAGPRAEIHASIAIPNSSQDNAQPAVCTLAPSLEIFDTITGKTTAIVTQTSTTGVRVRPVPAAGR